MPEEGEQPGEGLLLPEVVEEPLQPDGGGVGVDLP